MFATSNIDFHSFAIKRFQLLYRVRVLISAHSLPKSNTPGVGGGGEVCTQLYT